MTIFEELQTRRLRHFSARDIDDRCREHARGAPNTRRHGWMRPRMASIKNARRTPIINPSRRSLNADY